MPPSDKDIEAFGSLSASNAVQLGSFGEAHAVAEFD
jgi:hypothetical protein